MVTHTHRGGGELQILLRPPPKVTKDEAEAPPYRGLHQPQEELLATAADGDDAGDRPPVVEGEGGDPYQGRGYVFNHSALLQI